MTWLFWLVVGFVFLWLVDKLTDKLTAPFEPYPKAWAKTSASPLAAPAPPPTVPQAPTPPAPPPPQS